MYAAGFCVARFLGRRAMIITQRIGSQLGGVAPRSRLPTSQRAQELAPEPPSGAPHEIPRWKFPVSDKPLKGSHVDAECFGDLTFGEKHRKLSRRALAAFCHGSRDSRRAWRQPNGNSLGT